MRYPKLVYLLTLYGVLLAMAGTVGLQQYRIAQQQQQLQQFGEQLTSQLPVDADAMADFVSLAGSGAPSPLLSLQLFDAKGQLLTVAREQVPLPALSADGWSKHSSLQLWRRTLPDGRVLVLVAAEPALPLLTLCLIPLLLLPLWLVAYKLQKNQLQLLVPLWQQLGANRNKPTSLAVDVEQLRLSVQVLQEELQGTKLQWQQALLSQTELFQQQQADRQESAAKLQTERQNLIQQQWYVGCWQALATKSAELPEAELRHWLKVLYRLQQNPQRQEQSFAVQDLMSALVRTMQPMWPATVLLLPDEDPQSSSYQADTDAQLLHFVLQSLLLTVKPLVEGREVVLSSRLQVRQPSELHYSVQFNGRRLPDAFRSMLLHDTPPAPQWADIQLYLCRQLLNLSAGQLQITELADLGCRLELKFKCRWHKVAQRRRWQNLVLCDRRPCRRELWQRSLLGISEQVVLVDEIAQLPKVANHRLVDMIVVHLWDEQLSNPDIAILQEVAARYPFALFAPQAVRDQLPASFAGRWLSMPLLLTELQSLLQQPDQPLQQQQLLVVDDNPTNLSFIRAMLAGQGIGMDIATTGTEALQLAAQSRYQLILMDIQLPDVSGVEVTRQLRQLRHHQHTNILAFTAHALPEEVASFRLAGMDDVMIKPLDARKIAHIMSRLTPVTEI